MGATCPSSSPCMTRSGCSTSRMILAGSNVRKLWNHGVSACRRTSGSTPSQPVAGHDGALNLLLQRQCGLFFCFGARRLLERPRHLREVGLGTLRPDRGDQGSRGNPILLRCRDEGHRPPVAIADDRDPASVDVLPAAEIADGGAHVFGVIVERGSFGAAAALAHSALVVPKDVEPGIGKGAGDVAEDRDACDGFVPIGRAGAADEHNRRPRLAVGVRGFGERRGDREAIRLDAHLLVTRRATPSPGAMRPTRCLRGRLPGFARER